jgi:hypothetical protein
MSMDVNAVQELNADSLMTVTLLGMETEVSPVQLAKAPFSIFFIPLSIMTVVSLLHPAKALSH